MINNLNFKVPQTFNNKESQANINEDSQNELEEINMTDPNDNTIKKRTRHPFSKQEDKRLLELVHMYGFIEKYCWNLISNKMKGRSPRQCRERYQLFLSYGVRKKITWTKEEDKLLLSKYETLGPRWKQMEEFFSGRNAYTIKNRYVSLKNQKIKKDLELKESFDQENQNDFEFQDDFDEFNQFDSFGFDNNFNIF